MHIKSDIIDHICTSVCNIYIALIILNLRTIKDNSEPQNDQGSFWTSEWSRKGRRVKRSLKKSDETLRFGLYFEVSDYVFFAFCEKGPFLRLKKSCIINNLRLILMRFNSELQILLFHLKKGSVFLCSLIMPTLDGIKSDLRIRGSKSSESGEPKYDDSAHRILKSKNGIGLQSSKI